MQDHLRELDSVDFDGELRNLGCLRWTKLCVDMIAVVHAFRCKSRDRIAILGQMVSLIYHPFRRKATRRKFRPFSLLNIEFDYEQELASYRCYQLKHSPCANRSYRFLICGIRSGRSSRTAERRRETVGRLRCKLQRWVIGVDDRSNGDPARHRNGYGPLHP